MPLTRKRKAELLKEPPTQKPKCKRFLFGNKEERNKVVSSGIMFNNKNASDIEVKVWGAPCNLSLHQRVICKNDVIKTWISWNKTSCIMEINEDIVCDLCSVGEGWKSFWVYFGLLYGITLYDAELNNNGIWMTITVAEQIQPPLLIDGWNICKFLLDEATEDLFVDRLVDVFKTGTNIRSPNEANYPELNLSARKKLLCIFCERDNSYHCSQSDIYYRKRLARNYMLHILAKSVELETDIYQKTTMGKMNMEQKQVLNDLCIEFTDNTMIILYLTGRYLCQNCTVVGFKSNWNLEDLPVSLSSSLQCLQTYWNHIFPDLDNSLKACCIVSGSNVLMCTLKFGYTGLRNRLLNLFPESDVDVFVIGCRPLETVSSIINHLKSVHNGMYIQKEETSEHDDLCCFVVTIVLPTHPVLRKAGLFVQLICFYCKNSMNPMTAEQIVFYHHLDPVRTYYQPSTNTLHAFPSAIVSWITGNITSYRPRREDQPVDLSVLFKYIRRGFGISLYSAKLTEARDLMLEKLPEQVRTTMEVKCRQCKKRTLFLEHEQKDKQQGKDLQEFDKDLYYAAIDELAGEQIQY